MSSTLTIEDKEYVTATVAGRHFEYTKEYILYLIKQGKIDGRKVGHKWYVNIPSAEVFFRDAQEVRTQRNNEIREVRKIELKQHTKAKAPSKHHAVLVETLAVLVLALGIGTAGYMGTTTGAQTATVSESNVSFFESFANSIFSFFSPQDAVVFTKEVIPTTPASQNQNTASAFDGVSAQIGTTTHTAIVVAPGEIFTATTVQAVRESFSDPVEVSVDPANADTGVITPIFKGSDSEEYRFLMVPIKTGS